MSFFYLPDEVKYHRLPANFFSLPKDVECDRFEIVTAAVRAQSTSRFSEQDFVCAPGEVNAPCILCVHVQRMLCVGFNNCVHLVNGYLLKIVFWYTKEYFECFFSYYSICSGVYRAFCS